MYVFYKSITSEFVNQGPRSAEEFEHLWDLVSSPVCACCCFHFPYPPCSQRTSTTRCSTRFLDIGIG